MRRASLAAAQASPACSRRRRSLRRPRRWPPPIRSPSAGFDNPPQGARPRVWWHWLNGNVTKEGIEKDLDWMARSGLGGLQNFDAEMMTPQLVPNRLPYMSPGLGGRLPFRRPAGRGKAARIRHRRLARLERNRRTLGAPRRRHEEAGLERNHRRRRPAADAGAGPLPRTTGPFQDLFVQPDIMGHRPDAAKLASRGGEIAVFAMPLAAPALPMPAVSVGDTTSTRPGWRPGTKPMSSSSRRLPPTSRPSSRFDYPAPQTVRSATIWLPGVATLFDGASLQPRWKPASTAHRGAKSPSCLCPGARQRRLSRR
jgi:hypothetical protein